MMRTLLIITIVIMGLQVSAQDGALRKKHFNIENGVALQGYDPVAYFTDNKALKGSTKLALSFQGVIYYFATEAHKEMFKKNPANYEPQYGGWCAYAMGATGEKVEIDPETFKIISGKLFLFYNKRLNNTLKTWNKDEVNLHKKADANWIKIYKA